MTPTPATKENAMSHRVTQTILYDPDLNTKGVWGNCIQAAVASYFGLPLDAVPHFLTFAMWDEALLLWLDGHGLTWRQEHATEPPEPPHAPCLLSGRSPRGIGHVVYRAEDGEIWDPHPSRDGLTEVRSIWWFEPRPVSS